MIWWLLLQWWQWKCYRPRSLEASESVWINGREVYFFSLKKRLLFRVLLMTSWCFSILTDVSFPFLRLCWFSKNLLNRTSWVSFSKISKKLLGKTFGQERLLKWVVERWCVILSFWCSYGFVLLFCFFLHFSLILDIDQHLIQAFNWVLQCKCHLFCFNGWTFFFIVPVYCHLKVNPALFNCTIEGRSSRLWYICVFWR